MKNLLILFGGQSSEHVVSRISTASVFPNIDREEFEISVVGITKNGEWFLTEAEPEEIASGEWEKRADNLPAFLSPNRMFGGLQVLEDGELTSRPVDCVFPIMHGEMCEDGALQGLLEMCGIPYVGPNISASACSMDKAITKLVAATAGVRQAKYSIVTSGDIDNDIDAAAAAVEENFAGEYPLFVKPASAGSSVGVSKAHNNAELKEALVKAKQVCRKILVEETIVGREVEVAVLGNEDATASVVGEVLSANDFYDYEAKYENSASRTVIPAEISAEASQKLREAAVRIYKALGCAVLSRVDFFLLEDGNIVFNEINTLPGFTSISMYPKLCEASGTPYRELLTKLCDYAIVRGCQSPLK